MELVQEEHVQSQIETNIELVRMTAEIQMNFSLEMLQIIHRANAFLSAQYSATEIISTYYSTRSDIVDRLLAQGCFNLGPVAPAAFYSMTLCDSVNAGRLWPEGQNNRFSSTISGWTSSFFIVCFATEALLPSKLDCLHDIECQSILANYFPSLSRVCIQDAFVRL